MKCEEPLEDNYVVKHDKLLRSMHMTVECASPDFARVSMPLLDEFKNGMGVAHGGTIFSLADVAFGAASNSGRTAFVVNMCTNIEYLLPGRIGPLIAEAHSVRLGKHILSYDIQIFDGERNMIARAMFTGYATNAKLPE